MHSSPPTRTPPLDERLWPLVVVLTIWASVVSAVIVAAGGFDDPRPWGNGWLRLLTVGATWAALVWAAVTVYPRRARRLTMAVVASLAAHSLLAVVLHRAWIEFSTMPVPPHAELAAHDDANKELLLPEHVRDPERHRNQQDAFERPVATSQPAAAAIVQPRRPARLEALAGANSRSVAALADATTTPPPQLRRPTWEATMANAAPTDRAQRRRSTAHVKLPKRTVPMPELAAHDRATAADNVARASSVGPLTRTVPPTASPIVSTMDSPARIGAADRPPLTIAPRRADETAVPSERMLPALPTREPRLAMLPRASDGAGRTPATASMAASSRQSAPAFARRVRATPRNGDGGRPRGPMPTDVDAAVALGLEFLAGVQRADGRWSFNYLGGAVAAGSESVNIQADAAATGLAMLAFLGAGHDHLDGRYQRVIHDALDYLVRIQDDTGALFPEDGQPTGQVARFYGHGMATLALCEAYGMTGDQKLRGPAQRAIDYLVETQHDQYGGWRYVPGTNSDLSVTGWQLIALRSGRLAGLAVPPQSIERIRDCLERCRDDEGEGALFRYNPWASPTDPTTRHGREPSTVMTSVGLLMQLYLDGDPADPRIERAGEHLLANLPQVGDAPVVAPTGTLGNPQRDTYYWYYATLAMHAVGGDYWSAWRGRLEPLLVDSQVTSGPAAGSWDPLHPVPDKWAAYGGRLYVTALNLLSLEADDRHLSNQTTPPRVAERP
jgi:hypothetical protein